MGWGVRLEDGVYTGWSGSLWDGLLVNGMVCYCMGWSVRTQKAVLVYRMDVEKPDWVLIYRMSC